MSRQSIFVSRQSLALDWVFMSRQSILTARHSLAYTGNFRSQSSLGQRPREFTSRQSCLSLCRNRVNPPSRQKVPGHGVFMSRHSALCHDSGARHCVATRLCACDRDALSRQYGAVLRRDREGHARATDEARHARQTRLGTHARDRLGRAHDRGILSRQRFLCRDRLLKMVKKKKKKKTHGRGASQIT